MPPFEFDPSPIKPVQNAFDLTVMKLFADYLFKGDLSRVLYAPNAYCFRLRTNKTNMVSQLNLPFMNLQCVNWSQEDTLNWYSHPALYRGELIEGLESKLFFKPIQLLYESNVWCRNQKDAEAVLRMLTPFMKNHLTVEFDLDLYTNPTQTEPAKKAGTLRNIGMLDFDNLELGSEFAEKDWLEKNQIYQVSTAFKVATMWVSGSAPVYPTEEVLFSFTNEDSFQGGTPTIEELYSFVVDHTLDTTVDGIVDHSKDELVLNEEETP